jgi:hypothetical protein
MGHRGQYGRIRPCSISFQGLAIMHFFYKHQRDLKIDDTNDYPSCQCDNLIQLVMKHMCTVVPCTLSIGPSCRQEKNPPSTDDDPALFRTKFEDFPHGMVNSVHITQDNLRTSGGN